jgi:hypothetical protein
MTKEPDIQQAHVGRKQSPDAERLMGKSIHDVLTTLLGESYLYQNRSVDVGAIVAKADENYSAAALEDEFTHRPWIPYSRNRGFTSAERNITNLRLGRDPLGAPLREMHLTFVLPTIETWCSTCRSRELHDSIPHLELSPYHLNPEAIEEPLGVQTFLFNYQCHKCKSPPVTFMVRREHLKLQLCGRSKPYFPVVPREIPKSLRLIYSASVAAAACGDLAAGFYHLRTLLEHHMKAACVIPTQEQIDGADLCQRYNKVVDPIVAERAALTKLFTDCCVSLHSRTGSHDDFKAALQLIEGHFKLVGNLKALGSR